MLIFDNRSQAGRLLAAELQAYAGREKTLILALPRGGVPVAFEVASSLHLPLELFLVRKLGVPGQEELAMGAVAAGGVMVLNDQIVQSCRIAQSDINRVAAAERMELERRNLAYRQGRPPIRAHGQTVILIDDGLATGATMKAAVLALRQMGASRIVVAVPVGPRDTCEEFERIADELVCLETPAPFHSIGTHYVDFGQVSDDEVRRLLAKGARVPAHESPLTLKS